MSTRAAVSIQEEAENLLVDFNCDCPGLTTAIVIKLEARDKEIAELKAKLAAAQQLYDTDLEERFSLLSVAYNEEWKNHDATRAKLAEVEQRHAESIVAFYAEQERAQKAEAKLNILKLALGDKFEHVLAGAKEWEQATHTDSELPSGLSGYLVVTKSEKKKFDPANCSACNRGKHELCIGDGYFCACECPRSEKGEI